MAWEVEYTDEFSQWWETLTEHEQIDVAAYVRRLQSLGPELRFPYSSGVRGSRHGAMRELRVQSGGKPIRVFYAFDLRRTAILLIGGKKAGNNRFYEQFVRVADQLFDQHLTDLRSEHEREITHARHTTIRGASSQDVTRGKGPRGSKG